MRLAVLMITCILPENVNGVGKTLNLRAAIRLAARNPVERHITDENVDDTPAILMSSAFVRRA